MFNSVFELVLKIKRGVFVFLGFAHPIPISPNFEIFNPPNSPHFEILFYCPKAKDGKTNFFGSTR